MSYVYLIFRNSITNILEMTLYSWNTFVFLCFGTYGTYANGFFYTTEKLCGNTYDTFIPGRFVSLVVGFFEA